MTLIMRCCVLVLKALGEFYFSIYCSSMNSVAYSSLLSSFNFFNPSPKFQRRAAFWQWQKTRDVTFPNPLSVSDASAD